MQLLFRSRSIRSHIDRTLFPTTPTNSLILVAWTSYDFDDRSRFSSLSNPNQPWSTQRILFDSATQWHRRNQVYHQLFKLDRSRSNQRLFFLPSVFLFLSLITAASIDSLEISVMKNDDPSSMIFLGYSPTSEYQCQLPQSHRPMELRVEIRDQFDSKSHFKIFTGVISDSLSLIEKWINQLQNDDFHIENNSQTINHFIITLTDRLNDQSYSLLIF